MEKEYQVLFEPIKIGGVELKTDFVLHLWARLDLPM